MKTRTSIWGAVLAAAGSAASGLCCLPIALGTLGTSAAFASILGPLRPYFTGLSIVFWLAAFYALYRPGIACQLNGCNTTDRLRRQRMILWVAGLISVALNTLSYWSSWVIYWLL